VRCAARDPTLDDGDVFCCNRVVSWLEQLAAERGVREDGGAVAAAARFGETEGVWRETRIEMEKKRGEDATLVRANPEVSVRASRSTRERAAERRCPTGRERTGSLTMQTLQDPILPWLCFRGGGFPNPKGLRKGSRSFIARVWTASPEGASPTAPRLVTRCENRANANAAGLARLTPCHLLQRRLTPSRKRSPVLANPQRNPC
jgi:hypothetical protein